MNFPHPIGRFFTFVSEPSWQVLRFTFICSVAAAIGWGAVIVSTVGDQDALQTGTLPGGLLPAGPFDHRSATEVAAADGSERTDVSTLPDGLAMDAAFLHTFILPGGMTVGQVVLELGIGGLEGNDIDPNTSLLGEDALRLDGILVAEAFAGVNQGPLGYDILKIVLPSSVLPQFADGSVSVAIDLNSNAGLGLSTRVEPVFYDFSRLTITQIPEPQTAWLLAVGAALCAIARLRRRSHV